MTSLFVFACGSSDQDSVKPVVVLDSDSGNDGDTTDVGMSNDTSDECCAGRQCGIDPNCGESCGSCSSGEVCTEGGSCVEADPNAPKILDFSSNVNTVTPSQSARISIVVTDPDGIDDVIGGSMKSPTGASYGSFQTESSEGAYEIVITWEDIISIEAVQFGLDGGTLVLIAEFFDQDGNVARESKTLGLTCDDPQNEAACEVDTCINVLESEDHCGACGNLIDVIDGQCEDGAFTCGEAFKHCPEQNMCAFIHDPHNCGECGVDCETVINSRIGPDTERMFSDMPPICGGTDSSYCLGRFETDTQQSCDDACGSMVCEGATARYGSSGHVIAGIRCDEIADDTRYHNGFEHSFNRMECRCKATL